MALEEKALLSSLLVSAKRETRVFISSAETLLLSYWLPDGNLVCLLTQILEKDGPEKIVTYQ